MKRNVRVETVLDQRTKRRRVGGQTITDVARHAGVSPMTVSRVINGEKNVREATRERVSEAIRELGYSPNAAARSLASARAVSVGLLYANPSAAYLSEFLLGSLDQCSRSGFQLVVQKCDTDEAEMRAVDRLVAAGVDGVILPPPLCDSPQTLKELEERGIPVVAVATGSPVPGVSSVRIDDYQGARAMTRHLLELGHTRIGFIQGDPNHTPAQLRRQAFLDTMAEAGISVRDEYMTVGMFTYRSGLTAARQLLELEQRPTAIFCSNDDMAAAAMAMGHGMGIRIPDELTVVGFDDTPMATTLWPELTTIRQPVTAMGKAAVALMLEEVRARRNGRHHDATHQVMKHALVKRQSSAPA